MSFQPEPTQEQAPAWLVAADRKPASSEPVPKSIDLVEQLRKSRRQRNLLAIGGMILAAVGLLGFASYRFLSNRMQLAQQQEKKNTQGNIAQAPTTGEKQTGTKTPELVIAPNKRNGKQTSQQPLPELPSVRKDPDPSATPPADPAMNEAVNPAPAQTAPSPDVPTPNAPTPTPEPKPEPAPEPKPEPAMTSESDQWKKGMTQARELLALGDLKKFDSMMAGLLDKAVTKEGKDQTARLDQAGQLYKIYVESFEEAKRKAKGASALKVGNTEVSIVETTPEKIIIRQGENKSYAWDKLPFGIAAALSDLGLSESAPVDVAARAIYFSVTPFYQEAAKANNLITKRIDGWFERSAGKESIRADLKQFLTDKYE
jgi:hypothetical protein